MDVEHSSARTMQELLRLARAGDERALGALLEEHRAYLRLLCRLEIGRLLQAKVDASDVVQDTFLRAHRAFGEFRGTGVPEFVGWLRRILARQLSNTIRHYRGTQRRDVRVERDLNRHLDQSSRALAGAVVQEQTSPSLRASREEEALGVAEAIESLPADYRDVILFHHLQGLDFGQVAALMQRSVGSVQKLWLRALAKLRRELGGVQ
jgi:RNA polymerase sigma-70 factor (ECF subfamily)